MTTQPARLFVHAGSCEGRKLVVNNFRKDSYCWVASPKGPAVCNTLYTNKATPPMPCIWDTDQTECIRAEMFTCLACPKCGSKVSDTRGIISSCCAPGGAWDGKCGDEGEAEYTWNQGVKACRLSTRRKNPVDCLPNSCVHIYWDIFLFFAARYLHILHSRYWDYALDDFSNPYRTCNKQMS